MSISTANGTGFIHRYRLPILILLSYCLLSTVMTWPLIAQLGTSIPGRIGDGYVHLWTFSWIRDALQAGQTPYQTDLLFFPVGANLLNHNIAWVHIAAWLPLQALLGADVSYSLIYLLAFPLNGFAVYLLGREQLDSEAAAFVSGLVAGFWPYNLSHFDHPNLILICWLPLAILFLGRTIANQRWRDALLAGIFIALLGITRWQLLIIGGFLIALYLLYMFVTDKQAREGRTIMLLLFTGIVALLLMLPLLYPILEYQVTRPDIADIQISDELPYATDLLAYFVPNRFHPLWGSAIAQFSKYFTGNNNYTRAVGYTVLFLVAYGLIKRFRQGLFWLIAAAVYLLLALGPDLFVYGRAIIPLPYRFLESLTLMQLVRFPDRYNVVLSIPVAMLAGQGVYALTAGLRRDKVLRRTAVLSALLLFEYLVTFDMLSLHTPAWYAELAEESGQFGILDVPMRVQTWDTKYNFYQLTHGKPLVEGHVSRPSPEMFDYINSVPLLGAIYAKERPPIDFINPSPTMRQLQAGDIRYLIVHKEFLGPDDVTYWRQWLVVPPIYEDEDILVFETGVKEVGEALPWLARAYSDPATGETVGLVSVILPDEPQTPGYWIEANTVWSTTGPVSDDLGACLQLLSTDGEAISTHCDSLSESYPSSSWQADDLVHTTQVVEVPALQEPGTYNIGVTLTKDGEALSDSVAIGQVEIAALPRVFELPPVDHETAAQWADEITLRGYDATLTDGALELTLYWQALRRMEDSYKVFVHVINAADGQMAGQVDTVPREWSYPTNWWETGEIVSDALSIPLEMAPGDSYEIRVGIYRPETGERLPVRLQGTGGETSDYLVLQTME